MSSGYPDTRKEMLRAGYRLLQSRPCKLCRETIELWRTTHGKEMYFDPMASDHDESMPHRVTCKAAKKYGATRQQTPQRIHEFAASHNAAAVIVLDRNLRAEWSLASDCHDEPQDIHNAITAAADDLSRYLANRINEEAR